MNKSLRKPKFHRISADININVLPVKLKKAAHHIAGRKHLDHADKRFREVAADLYEREGFPSGMPSDGCGNM